MQPPRAILFVDGENLVMRYQALVAAGRVPLAGVSHVKDVYVWHGAITEHAQYDFARVVYYTSVVGDEVRVNEIKGALARIIFKCQPDHQASYTGQLLPKVFKKSAQSQKTRNVDIQIVIDVMRHAHSNAFNLIFIASGDGDYLPLVSEVMHSGKQVYVAAFSSGLNPALTHSVDEFVDLDAFFFAPASGS